MALLRRRARRTVAHASSRPQAAAAHRTCGCQGRSLMPDRDCDPTHPIISIAISSWLRHAAKCASRPCRH
eukprot:scaffold4641_cov117-Isochrysis_galbana.AAC.12